MSEELIISQFVQIQVIADEQAALAGQEPSPPPDLQQAQTREALFARVPALPLADGPALLQSDQPSREDQQAAAAMALLFAQQMAMSLGESKVRTEERRARGKPEDDQDPDNA
jgi:hypothetical protein